MSKTVIFTFSIIFFAFLSSCTFTKKIKDGSMAFELKQYSIAVDMLYKEYQQANDQPSKARIAFTLGESYWKMGDSEEALPWYQKAVSHNFGPRAKERQAFTLKKLERYNEATVLFRELLNEGSQIDLYRKEIAICRLASDWVQDKLPDFKVDKSFMNSRSSDYSPIYLDNNRVFFSSDRSNGTSEEVYKWTGRDYSDIYMYNNMTGEISHLDPVINSENNEGTMCFNKDGSILFFTRCYTETGYDDFCKIMKSSYDKLGSWSEPVILPFITEGVNYGHPFWVEKDSILFYSAELQSGNGGFDIYFTTLDSLGNWSNGKNLGPTINTIGDEKFPVIKDDTLYFASDGHAGMGGLDIFYSYIENGKWVRPYNMKSPINSGADDFSIAFEPNVESFYNRGLFTSSRGGDDDIYTFNPIKRKPKIDKEIVTDKDTLKELKLAITVFAEDENGTKKIFPKANILINDIPDKLNAKSFLLKGIEEGEYAISVNYPGYFSVKKVVSTSNSDIEKGKTSYTYNTTMILKPIVRDKEIVLENILYDFNESYIRADAKPSLIELTSLLTENPEILIELSSHTDCRGPDKYNLKLSQDRAQAAVDFIVELGIDESRITAKGYGENSPVANCSCDECSEEEHQENRRTAFKIVGVK